MFKRCRGDKHRAVDLLLFPVIVVTVFSLYPLLFPFKLGDGQTPFLVAIQAVDLVGVFGLDFMLAFVNILIYTYIQPLDRKPGFPVAITGLLLVVFWFGYGVFNLTSWDRKIEGWRTVDIGFVQPNRPASLELPKPEKGYSREYPLELEMSEKLAASGKTPIVVWPEGHFYGYVFWPSVRRSFHRHIQNMDTPVIIYDATYEEVSGIKRYYNSSIYINRDGEEEAKYNKIKLVPFGEYTPVIGRIPVIRDLLGDYQSNLSRGEKNVFFNVMGVWINPKICYEPLFSASTAQSVAECPDGCVILVQSQDGWYGDTSQPGQHTAATILRSVENRVPLIHVINNGPSSVITPNGRVAFQTDRHKRGYWLAEMPHDKTSGGSFYSRHPYLFLNTVRFVFLAFFLLFLGQKVFIKTQD